jgi:hypothetical protein
VLFPPPVNTVRMWNPDIRFRPELCTMVTEVLMAPPLICPRCWAQYPRTSKARSHIQSLQTSKAKSTALHEFVSSSANSIHVPETAHIVKNINSATLRCSSSSFRADVGLREHLPTGRHCKSTTRAVLGVVVLENFALFHRPYA